MDPLEYLDGPNASAYVNSKPMSRRDPHGTDIIDVLVEHGWDALSTADQARIGAYNTGLPGAHGGPQDAVRHCIWTCEMTKRRGRQFAMHVAKTYEGPRTGRFAADQDRHMDMYNFRQGTKCPPSKNCVDCCVEKLNNGELKMWGGGSMPDGTPIVELKPFKCKRRSPRKYSCRGYSHRWTEPGYDFTGAPSDFPTGTSTNAAWLNNWNQNDRVGDDCGN